LLASLLLQHKCRPCAIWPKRGIGTNTPQEKLHVAGNIKQTLLKPNILQVQEMQEQARFNLTPLAMLVADRKFYCHQHAANGTSGLWELGDAP